MKIEKTIIVQRLTGLLHAHADSKALDVRAHGSNLIIARHEVFQPGAPPERDDRIRLTQLAKDHFGLSVKRHTGRWEPTPFQGSLAEMVEVMRSVMRHVLAPMGI